MAPTAGVSEALTAAQCRVALAFALCQTACVVNRRLGSCRGARGLWVKAEAPFWFKSVPRHVSVQCPPVIFISVTIAG